MDSLQGPPQDRNKQHRRQPYVHPQNGPAIRNVDCSSLTHLIGGAEQILVTTAAPCQEDILARSYKNLEFQGMVFGRAQLVESSRRSIQILWLAQEFRGLWKLWGLRGFLVDDLKDASRGVLRKTSDVGLHGRLLTCSGHYVTGPHVSLGGKGTCPWSCNLHN